MQKNGAGFAGFFHQQIVMVNPNSLIQLPWNKEIGWLASDLYMDGGPVDASPRVMLKNQIKKLSEKNFK